MILRRGPVLAAFLLCFLAKVRGGVSLAATAVNDNNDSNSRSSNNKKKRGRVKQSYAASWTYFCDAPPRVRKLDPLHTHTRTLSTTLHARAHIRCIHCSVFSPLTGVRGIRTIRVPNLVDAQRQRGAAERRVLRRRAEHLGQEVHAGRVRYFFQSLPKGIPVQGLRRGALQLRNGIYGRPRGEYVFFEELREE